MSITRPDPGVVEQLVDMGFEEEKAKIAAIQSHNCGVEAAANWLMEHPNAIPASSSLSAAQEIAAALNRHEEPVVGVPADVTTIINPGGDHSFGETLGFGAECKAVLVVAKNLYMSTGKIASQCAHAAVGLYKVMMANRVPWYQAFEEGGEKTVVVSAEEGDQLENLALQADQLLLPNFLVSDAGRTEVLPGSVTVLGIAGPSETVDKVTGNLKLLQ